MTTLNEEEVDYLRGLTYFVEPQHLKVLTAFLAHGDRIDLNNVLLINLARLSEVLVTDDTTYAKSISIKLLGHLVERWEQYK